MNNNKVRNKKQQDKQKREDGKHRIDGRFRIYVYWDTSSFTVTTPVGTDFFLFHFLKDTSGKTHRMASRNPP